MLPPLGAHAPPSRIFRIRSFGTGSGFSRRIDRVVRMISNKSSAFWSASGIACSVSVVSAVTAAASMLRKLPRSWSQDNDRIPLFHGEKQQKTPVLAPSQTETGLQVIDFICV